MNVNKETILGEVHRYINMHQMECCHDGYGHRHRHQSISRLVEYTVEFITLTDEQG